MCLGNIFYRHRGSIGNGMRYGFTSLLQRFLRLILIVKHPWVLLNKTTTAQERTQCLVSNAKHLATSSQLKFPNITMSKQDINQTDKTCYTDMMSEFPLKKMDWIDNPYFAQSLQMSYFSFHILATLRHNIESHIKLLIDLKTSFKFATSFAHEALQLFTKNSLKKEYKNIHSRLHGLLRFLLFCFVVSSPLHVADAAKGKGGFQCSSVTAQSACLPFNYSKFELPNPSGVNPVSIEILIEEVLRINDKDYSITFSCYYNIYWPDKRITLTPEFGKEQAKAYGPDTNITMNPNISVPMNLEMIKDLWLPNILIYNLKTYKVMDVLSKLAGLWILGDYTVMYSEATHITFICPMHFDKFPLDTQICKFQVGSYSYDDTQMTFQTLQARYNNKETNSIALDYSIQINSLSAKDSLLMFDGLGNFSLAGFELVLQRYVSTYIITYYLPSGLFVIVSWISFLIPMDVIPGRMALLVTLFLVLVNIFNNVTTNTPKAEGLTAIEAWMLACILFVFGALIE